MEQIITTSSISEKPDIEKDDLKNERFHLTPIDRLKTVAGIAGTVGAVSGLYEGVKMLSLRFLTENAHRLPTTVGGWYFYHKKKNYVMITAGSKRGLLLGCKYAGSVGTFFGLEAGLDYVRGTRDFLNTTAAAVTLAWTYARFKKLSGSQRANLTKRGGLLGLGLGLAQDAMITARGGSVWYADRLIGFSRSSSALAGAHRL